MPVFSALFFITTAFNMAVPLSLNWIGEFMSLAGIFQRSPLIGLLGASSIILSAAYSIYLYNRIAFGEYSKYLSFNRSSALDISRREFMLIVPLLITALVFGIIPNVILGDLHVAVSNLLYTT